MVVQPHLLQQGVPGRLFSAAHLPHAVKACLLPCEAHQLVPAELGGAVDAQGPAVQRQRLLTTTSIQGLTLQQRERVAARCSALQLQTDDSVPVWAGGVMLSDCSSGGTAAQSELLIVYAGWKLCSVVYLRSLKNNSLLFSPSLPVTCRCGLVTSYSLPLGTKCCVCL